MGLNVPVGEAEPESAVGTTIDGTCTYMIYRKFVVDNKVGTKAKYTRVYYATSLVPRPSSPSILLIINFGGRKKE